MKAGAHTTRDYAYVRNNGQRGFVTGGFTVCRLIEKLRNSGLYTRALVYALLYFKRKRKKQREKLRPFYVAYITKDLS